MSPFHRVHFIATAFVIGVAGACMAPSAIADSSVNVTFQPNTHWVQEVNTLNRYDYSRDYSVAIEPGKILQINLITRDPNIFFKIRNETSRQELVDTYKTGATTWSAPAGTAAATYTIHVYVQPDALQRDEKPKYALQIGQYGQSDMQVEATPVTFEANNPWAQEVGTLDAQGSARDYTVAAAGTYTVNVYADPSALPPGTRAGYALQIGHYAQNETQAAPAGTAAAPASTAAAPTQATPAAPTSTATPATPAAPATPATAGTSGN